MLIINGDNMVIINGDYMVMINGDISSGNDCNIAIENGQ